MLLLLTMHFHGRVLKLFGNFFVAKVTTRIFSTQQQWLQKNVSKKIFIILQKKVYDFIEFPFSISLPLQKLFQWKRKKNLGNFFYEKNIIRVYLLDYKKISRANKNKRCIMEREKEEKIQLQDRRWFHKVGQ